MNISTRRWTDTSLRPAPAWHKTPAYVVCSHVAISHVSPLANFGPSTGARHYAGRGGRVFGIRGISNTAAATTAKRSARSQSQRFSSVTTHSERLELARPGDARHARQR